MSEEITMSIKQFLELEKGNTTLKEIIHNNNLQSVATKIINNSKVKNIFTTGLVLTNICAIPKLASIYPKSYIFGKDIIVIGLLKNLTYGLCVAVLIYEVGKSLYNNKKEHIPMIITKYLIIFISLFYLKYAFYILETGIQVLRLK